MKEGEIALGTDGREVYRECRFYTRELLLVVGSIVGIEICFLPWNIELFKYVACSLVILPAAVLDYYKHLLYDWLVLPVMLAGYAINIYFNGLGLETLGASLGGCCCLGGLFLVILLMFNDGLGGGDVKFAFALGSWLTSWEEALLVFCLTFYLGLVVVINEFLISVVCRCGMKKIVPLGPMMAAGALLTIIFGDGLLKWYGSFL